LDGKPITDSGIATIRKWLEEHEFTAFSKDVTFDAVDLVCAENEYDPLVDYLNGLVWDGTPRVDTWLTDVYGTEHTEYTSAIGRCFLIAGAARGLIRR
jgi:predicted P-loop ATPase